MQNHSIPISLARLSIFSMLTGEIDDFKSQAELIQGTKLWKLLLSEGKYHAQKSALVDAKNYNDLETARGLLKATVIFEGFIQNIKTK